MIEWQILPDADALATAACARILAAARTAIAARGIFHLVLAGGATPLAIYRRLRQADFDGTRWQIWWGDERCLPVGDAQRNSRTAHEVWLGQGQVPAANIHPLPAELGPALAARRYAAVLPSDPFDLTLLGLGEDGHTASLFPGHDPGCADDAPAVLPIYGAPKPPAERVSLSCARLSNSRQVLFVVSGAAKQPALAAWRAGKELPAARIGAIEHLAVLADRAGADSEAASNSATDEAALPLTR